MTQAVPSDVELTFSAQQGPSPRERLLLAASKLFCRFGINAVGIDAVVAEAATAKATLYKAFGSKEQLVEAVLEREGRIWRDRRHRDSGSDASSRCSANGSPKNASMVAPSSTRSASTTRTRSACARSRWPTSRRCWTASRTWRARPAPPIPAC
jgi:AcrR family transcriptional regulator